MKLEIALTKKQSMFDRMVGRHENVFYGGAKGGGKSHGLREIMLKRRIETPNSYGVIFRKTYPELYNNHINPILKKFPELSQYYSRQNKEIHLPNGSVLAFRHCQYERDLSLHQGQEYHDLGIEEAGEWPESWFWTLKGSNRSSDPNIKPRCLLTGNPGGIGHKWLKRLFIDRTFRPGIEIGDDFSFVSAKVSDNPALIKSDPGYVNRLKANLNPLLVKAYLDGEWDLQAGQFFEMLSRDTHIVTPFEIPKHWNRCAGFDTGYNHPAAMVWIATDEDGCSYVYREFCKSGMRSEEIAEEVTSYNDPITSIPAGHDCWVKHAGAPSVEEKMGKASNYGIVMHKAAVARVAGAQQLRDYLAIQGNGQPRLKFFSTCKLTFDCIARMIHDHKNPEDVLKVDALSGDPSTGDDLYDALRYALMDRPQISNKPVKKRRRYQDEQSYVSWTAI